MTLSIGMCLAAGVWLIWLVRGNRLSLGLPIAYLASLLLIHVPGALAYVVDPDLFANAAVTEIGIRFTAIGSICFVSGVYLARAALRVTPLWAAADRRAFSWFCLLGGWLLIYGLSPFFRFPSISAAIGKGGAIWILGVILGLRDGLHRKDRRSIAVWATALMVYPSVMLLLGGFLSYGSAAIIVVCAALVVSTRSHWRVMTGVLVFVFVGLSTFVNYFQHRNEIRDEVWGGAPLTARVDSVTAMFRDFEWLDLDNTAHLAAFDTRLNQNVFVGLAAQRLDQGETDYLLGESVVQGLMSLIPRILWPDKPVFGGSPEIVARMTGLRLSTGTSFGVGNVMEFQINFGTPGVVVGFVLLGWLIGTLDLKAAIAERRGELSQVGFYFLPGVALIQPNGSLVELFSGSAAALAAAWGWQAAWRQWSAMRHLSQEPATALRPSSR